MHAWRAQQSRASASYHLGLCQSNCGLHDQATFRTHRHRRHVVRGSVVKTNAPKKRTHLPKDFQSAPSRMEAQMAAMDSLRGKRASGTSRAHDTGPMEASQNVGRSRSHPGRYNKVISFTFKKVVSFCLRRGVPVLALDRTLKNIGKI